MDTRSLIKAVKLAIAYQNYVFYLYYFPFLLKKFNISYFTWPLHSLQEVNKAGILIVIIILLLLLLFILLS